MAKKFLKSLASISILGAALILNNGCKQSIKWRGHEDITLPNGKEVRATLPYRTLDGLTFYSEERDLTGKSYQNFIVESIREINKDEKDAQIPDVLIQSAMAGGGLITGGKAYSSYVPPKTKKGICLDVKAENEALGKRLLYVIDSDNVKSSSLLGFIETGDKIKVPTLRLLGLDQIEFTNCYKYLLLDKPIQQYFPEEIAKQ